VSPPLSIDLADVRDRFAKACAPLRADLHRFCTRMSGDPCDGEDILQDTLAAAFYRYAELHDTAAFRSWIFRIAHNRCIDFLRARRRFEDLDGDLPVESPPLADVIADRRLAERALARIVGDLPPRERACIILKDLLDHSLEDIAAITGTSIGAVKAALHRGRTRVAAAGEPGPPRRMPAESRPLVERYLAAFNLRDWDAVRALLAEDARLEVVTVSEGPLRDACYFVNYARIREPWRLALAFVDGDEQIVHFRERDGAARPLAIVQLSIEGGAITQIRDFVHLEDLLAGCDVA
jgi:RNA polymerase sigma-70 factor, ECF subfamily